jgi:integrase
VISAEPAQGAAGEQQPERPAGLLEKLMAAVRPEFRSDVLIFNPRDPVFGAPPCLVRGCERPARCHQMCDAHAKRWITAERPGLDRFAAAADPRMWAYRQLTACQVPGCCYGRVLIGLCARHADAWAQAGRPALELWVAAAPPVKAADSAVACQASSCGLWAHAATPLCYLHLRRWKGQGRPDIEEFARSCGTEPVPATERIDLHALGPQLRLEIQYALQLRRDEEKSKIAPKVARDVIGMLAHTQLTSLLDWPEHTWAQRLPQLTKGRNARALLLRARQDIENLAFGLGWETEYPRDTWRLRTLGIDDGTVASVHFGDIPQLWLQDLARKWARWRLTTGLSSATVAGDVRAITRLARFLARQPPGPGCLGHVNRALLETYLADLRAEHASHGTLADHIGHLSAFFTAIRQHGWDDSLPATAVFFAEDYPRQPQRLPRAVAEHVMAQIEHPGNLSRWDNPAFRLITIILVRCGLRVKDAVRLPADCIARDSDGAPYLRYYNHKMKREALVPVDEELCQEIAAQRHRASQRWPAGVPVLFPRRNANLDGTRPASAGTYRTALYQWLQQCDIRDEYGQPVHLTPHQWRHTLGTRLINRDVPQEVVRKILDHDSHAMTAHYARIHDTTVRRHWEAARKVNVHGDTVILDPAGPLAEAAWAKQRLGRVTQALPNGYCGLPVQQSCPHANACLTCPMFITTPEFLPRHRQHRQQTLQIITAAEARGQTRLAEMNHQVASNLSKIITALENDGTQPGADTDAC